MNPDMTLLCSALEDVLQKLESGDEGVMEEAWRSARNALRHYKVKEEDDEELALAVECAELEELRGIVTGWVSGDRLMLQRDRDVLKRAMKAYRKRLKVTLLDAESTVSGSPMSAGRESDIVGIVPPERYPKEVWDTLVRQKRLRADRFGTYELPPGG